MKQTLLILALSVFGALGDEPSKIRVKVVVDGSIEASSFIMRELRALRDVAVVVTNEDYRIGLVVLETATQQQVPTGFALSLPITEGNSIPIIINMYTNRISDQVVQ